MYFPFNFKVLVFISQSPDVLGERGLITIYFVLKGRFVIVPSGLKFTFTAAYIVHLCTIGGDSGLVDDRCASTLAFHRALVTAVTGLVGVGIGGALKKAFVMTGND